MSTPPPSARNAHAELTHSADAEDTELELTPEPYLGSIPDGDAWSNFRHAVWQEGVPGRGAILPRHPTIPHALLALGAEERIGVTFLGRRREEPARHRSWGHIARESHRVAGRLAARGIGRGDRVVLALGSGTDFIVTLFGLQLLRALPVPAPPPSPARGGDAALSDLRRTARQVGARSVIAARRRLLLLGELSHDREVFSTEALRARGPLGPVPRRVRREDGALVLRTAGTSRPSRCALLSHRNLVANIHASGQVLGTRASDRALSWMPLHQGLGLVGALLFCVYWRLPLVLLPPGAVRRDPRRWLEAISDTRATLSLAPDSAYARCARRVRDIADLDLSSWRLALSCGEPVRAASLIRFAARFADAGFSSKAFTPIYGLSESTLGVSVGSPGNTYNIAHVDRATLAEGRAIPAKSEGAVSVVGMGRPLPGHHLVIVDARGGRVRENAIGHVVVRGPSLMNGYVPASETRRALRDGWLWTGDLGFLHQGELFLTGRADDLVRADDRHHFAEDIEAVAESVEGVRPGGSVAFGTRDLQGHRLTLLCETYAPPRALDELRDRVRRVLLDAFGTTRLDVVLVAPGSLPRTASGARQRWRARLLHERGSLGRSSASDSLDWARATLRSGSGYLRKLLK